MIKSIRIKWARHVECSWVEKVIKYFVPETSRESSTGVDSQGYHILGQEPTNFPRMWKLPQNSRLQKGVIKQVPHLGNKNIYSPPYVLYLHRYLAPESFVTLFCYMTT